MLDLTGFLLTSVIFFCGAFAQSIVGFGFNVLGVPFVTLLAGANTAVTIVSIPSFLNCILVLVGIRRKGGAVPLNVGRVTPLLITGAIGTAAGLWLRLALDPSIVLVCLGVLLLLFVLTDNARKNWRPSERHARPIAIVIGSTTGVLNGLAGISGPTLAPYLYTLKLAKEQFVYYLNLLFIFFGIFQLVSFTIGGLYTWERILWALALIPVSFAGIYAGVLARPHVSQLLFMRLVLIVIFITGLDLIRRGLHLF